MSSSEFDLARTSTSRLMSNADTSTNISRAKSQSQLLCKEKHSESKIGSAQLNLSCCSEQGSRGREITQPASARWRYSSTSSTDSVFAAHDHSAKESNWHSQQFGHCSSNHSRSKHNFLLACNQSGQ